MLQAEGEEERNADVVVVFGCIQTSTDRLHNWRMDLDSDKQDMTAITLQ
jgi:hypothetical protein